MTSFDVKALQEDSTRVQELLVNVMAAELHLTYFASRYGQDSPEYQDALSDFGNAWRRLKESRDSSQFLKEVKAS